MLSPNLGGPANQPPPTPNLGGGQQQPNNHKVNEAYVKNKINSMCGGPTKELFGFYEEGKDETLGTMLKRLCKMANNICDHCKEPMHKHYIDYYHKCGRIEIQIALHTKNDPQIKSQLSLMGIN